MLNKKKQNKNIFFDFTILFSRKKKQKLKQNNFSRNANELNFFLKSQLPHYTYTYR